MATSPCAKDVMLYVGPSPLAKVLETFVPKDVVMLYLRPLPLAKVYPWILCAWRCCHVILGPSPLAKVLETFVPEDYVACRAFALGKNVRKNCGWRLCHVIWRAFALGQSV